MKYLRNLRRDQQDEIRIKVSSSYLNLNFRKHHSVFNNAKTVLTQIVGNGCDEELGCLIYCSTSALKKMDTGLWITRENRRYSQFNKENPKHKPISWRKFKRLFDILEELGYIENFSGFRDMRQDDKMSSCILFTDKFINLFDKEHIAKFAKTIKQHSAIVRTKVDNEVVEIKNVQGIGKVREQVDEINNWLNTHKFTFITYTKPVDLQRVFIEHLEFAGRFYFGALQCIDSDKRRFFEIDDVSVTERDYVSNHMFMIAEKEGVDLPEGFRPYDVDVSDLLVCDNPKQIRNILKMCCMFLLNSGTPKATFTKFWNSNRNLITLAIESEDWKTATGNMFYKVSGFKNRKKIIERLVEHNWYAKDYFGNKGGTWDILQYEDSEILLRTMKKMMSLNVPFLPYHDSLLTQYDKGDILEQSMREAWKEVLGNDRYCFIDKKF